MDIFDAILEDHRKLREFLEPLVETHGDTAEREKLFQRFKIELKTHSAAEERCFYVPLMNHDLTQDKSRHSVAEHQELDEILKQLEATQPSSSAWLEMAKTLHERLHHHMEEEHKIFPLANKVLDDAEKTLLATEYQQEISSHKEKFQQQEKGKYAL